MIRQIISARRQKLIVRGITSHFNAFSSHLISAMGQAPRLDPMKLICFAPEAGWGEVEKGKLWRSLSWTSIISHFMALLLAAFCFWLEIMWMWPQLNETNMFDIELLWLARRRRTPKWKQPLSIHQRISQENFFFSFQASTGERLINETNKKHSAAKTSNQLMS